MVGSAILAGWASVDITPQLPCFMGGYSDRTAPADAVHDPVCAYALALGGRDAPFVVVVCDLIAVNEGVVEAVRERVASETADARIWIAATHTHSGPSVSRVLVTDKFDPGVVEHVIARVTRAVMEAVGRMHPVHAAWASGPINGIATNRDHPEDGVNIDLDLLCLYDDEQESLVPSAVLGSFPCHPTVMGADNLSISADLPGAFRRDMLLHFGANSWVALATGASADISTRHVREGQDFREVERLGRVLAAQARGLIHQSHPLTLATPSVRDQTVRLERKAVSETTNLEASALLVQEKRASALQMGNTAEARTLETTLQGIGAANQRTAMEVAGPEVVTIAGAVLGELKLVAIPGELYHLLGEKLRHYLGPGGFLLGYTNSYVGYLPTKEAYQSVDYEVLMSPFVAGSGERIVAAAIRLLERMGIEGTLALEDE